MRNILHELAKGKYISERRALVDRREAQITHTHTQKNTTNEIKNGKWNTARSFFFSSTIRVICCFVSMFLLRFFSFLLC